MVTSSSASSSALPAQQVRDDIADHMLRSENAARKLDGLPPLKVRRYAWNQNLPPVPREDDDDMLFADGDEVLLAEAQDFEESRPEDEVFFVKRGTSNIVQAKLSPSEKIAFDVAKDEAFTPFLKNQAFKAVKQNQTDPGKTVPMIYVLKWKVKGKDREANARVCLQGFHHEDATNGTAINVESPTLSKVGRSVVFYLCAMLKYRVFTADVKSAFLQSDDLEKFGITIYARPNDDMRRRLSRLIGLRDDEILQFTKAGFGDLRGPRIWNDKATMTVKECGFHQHPLDPCLFLHFRGRRLLDKFTYQALDGIMGLHVDDFLGGGEDTYDASQLQLELADYKPREGSFLADLACLSKAFKFGAWDFSTEQTFCGVRMRQTLQAMAITLDQ